MTRSTPPKLFAPDSLSGAVGAGAGAVIAGRVVGFGRGVVLTWLLTTHEVGLFHVALAVVNVLMPLCSLGLSQGVMRYAPAHEAAGTLASFMRRATILTLCVGASGALLLFLLAAPLGPVMFAADVVGHGCTDAGAPDGGSIADLVRVAAVCLFTLVVFHLAMDLMRGLRMFRAAGLMDVCGTVLFSCFAVLAPLAGFDSANAVLLTYGLGNIAAVIVFSPALVRCIRSHPVSPDAQTETVRIAGKLIPFSLWMAGASLSWHLLQQYSLWHLAKVSGNDAAGKFYAVRLFAQLVLLGALTISRALMSNVTRTWELGHRAEALRRLETGTKLGCLLILAAAVALSLTRDWLIRAFRPEYGDGLACFDALLLGYAWFGALGFLWIRFHLEERSVLSFWTSLVGVAANIVLAVALMGLADSPARPEAVSMILRGGWVCAGGAAASVLACLLVMKIRGQGPGRSTVALIGAMMIIGTGPMYGSVLLIVLLGLAASGIGLFTPTERATVVSWWRDR